MTDLNTTPAFLHRRKFLAGLGVTGGALMLPACATGPWSTVTATRAMLVPLAKPESSSTVRVTG